VKSNQHSTATNQQHTAPKSKTNVELVNVPTTMTNRSQSFSHTVFRRSSGSPWLSARVALGLLMCLVAFVCVIGVVVDVRLLVRETQTFVALR
jgi:hypothetical protein